MKREKSNFTFVLTHEEDEYTAVFSDNDQFSYGAHSPNREAAIARAALMLIAGLALPKPKDSD